MVSLLYVLIWWDLVPAPAWGKLHPGPIAMLIVTMISIRTQSVLKTHSFNRQKVSRVLYCFQSPWFQCIMIESGIFPSLVSRGGRMHVSKERENEKRKGGGEYSFLCVMSQVKSHWMVPKFTQPFTLLTLIKQVPGPHGT